MERGGGQEVPPLVWLLGEGQQVFFTRVAEEEVHIVNNLWSGLIRLDGCKKKKKKKRTNQRWVSRIWMGLGGAGGEHG